MTKILAVSSGSVMTHGADRLVSSGGTEFDRLANKTLVYVARDAIVGMSYTGSAYLEDIPTDEWIARALTGNTENVGSPPGFERGAATWTAQRIGDLPRWFDVGRATQHLAHELEALRPHLAGDETPPSILLSGVQWKRDRPEVWKPFLGVVECPPSVGAYEARFLEGFGTLSPSSSARCLCPSRSTRTSVRT